MSDREKKFRAEDAKHLLSNPLFIAAFKGVEDYLESRLQMCDASDKDAAQKVVVAKQLLSSVRREIERVIDDGVIADIRIAELEKKRFLQFRR